MSRRYIRSKKIASHASRAAATILFLVTLPLIGQNIPGRSGEFDTEGMIDDIIEAESAPIRRQEGRIDELERERDSWARIGRYLSTLQDAAGNLYGFRNPFSDRVANSSDPAAVSARASRDAQQRRTSVEVERTATADVFQSAPLPLDTRVPSGRYEFRVGAEELAFDFQGGTLDDFVSQANRQIGDLVEIRSIRDTRDTRILVFRSQRTGAQNRMEFGDQALNFAIEAGVIQEAPGDSVDVSPTSANTSLESGDRGEALFEDDTLRVGPTASATIATEAVPIEPHFVLELDISVVNLGEPQHEDSTPPEGPQIPETGAVELDGVRVPFADSLIEIPDWSPEEPPEEVEDLEMLYLRADGGEMPLAELSDSDGFITIEIPVGELAGQFEGLVVRNRNTFRELLIRRAELRDPDSRDGYEPVIAIEQAGDASLVIDGVRVTRDTNEIDDLIDDVTLELHSESRGQVAIEVEPDFERIEERLIEFLASYNELMTEINILTRNNREIIEQISWLEPDEVEAAEERLGSLQGNSTLNQLRSRMQTIMMNPYETSAGSRIRLLSQIGVSTDTRGSGSGIDFNRLRGYLELDDELFEASIRNEHRALRDLFGRDSSGNGAIDSGAAYEVNRYAQAFTQTGGLLANRRQNIDSNIDRAQTEISRTNDRLDRRKQQLRREFGQMEQSMNSMDDMRRRLDGLQNQ